MNKIVLTQRIPSLHIYRKTFARKLCWNSFISFFCYKKTEHLLSHQRISWGKIYKQFPGKKKWKYLLNTLIIIIIISYLFTLCQISQAWYEKNINQSLGKCFYTSFLLKFKFSIFCLGLEKLFPIKFYNMPVFYTCHLHLFYH